MSSDYVRLSGQGKCPSRPLSYHRTVIRGDLPLVRIMGGLLASAYLRTVFLWMPNSLAIARMERPRSLIPS